MADEAADPTQGRNNRRAIGCVVALVVVILGVPAACMALTAGGGTPKGATEDGAIRACYELVERQLKAPSTARFNDERVVVRDENGAWSFTGNVDAQNSFGAQVRTRWACDVHWKDPGWSGTATLLD